MNNILEFIGNALFIGSIVLVVAFIVQLVKRKKDKPYVVKMFSGSLGSGKTFLATNRIVKLYRKYRRQYERNAGRKKPRSNVLKPLVFSNIPLYLGRGEYSRVLTREHLLLIKPFPSNCIPLVLIDEVGLIANQYSYDDFNIISENVNDRYQCFEVFIRFFRHFYGGNNGGKARLFVTDQASGGVNINLRRRFGDVANLNGFRRWLVFSPFYKIDVIEMKVNEDNIQQVEIEDDKQEFYFGFLPYRFMQKWKIFKPCYDSYVFYGAKYSGFTSKLNFTNWKDNDYSYIVGGQLVIAPMQTNYCPDLRMTAEERAENKAKNALLLQEAKKRLSS